jgi:hypothetical protein
LSRIGSRFFNLFLKGEVGAEMRVEAEMRVGILEALKPSTLVKDEESEVDELREAVEVELFDFVGESNWFDFLTVYMC